MLWALLYLLHIRIKPHNNRCSSGCAHCYMFRRDIEYGKDPTRVHKTSSFNLPVRRYRAGEHKGLYKVPSGSTFYTCFTSDFFHKSADEWRPSAWDMMKARSDCTFFMVTKRPERIAFTLPPDWGAGYENVHISVTCENQYWADKRLPIFLILPIISLYPSFEKTLAVLDRYNYVAGPLSEEISISSIQLFDDNGNVIQTLTDEDEIADLLPRLSYGTFYTPWQAGKSTAMVSYEDADGRTTECYVNVM